MRDEFYDKEGRGGFVVSDDAIEDGSYVCNVMVYRYGERDLTISKSFPNRVDCKAHHKHCVNIMKNENKWEYKDDKNR